MKKLNPYSRIAIAISALLLIFAYFVPLWQILMWAPQYPEGLDMKIWINNITGDVKIISALNHYIGMKHIEVGMFPEFSYMIYIVATVIAIGLAVPIINKRFMLLIFIAVLVACGLAALIDFYLWGYDYGHNLDPTAPIVVPGMSYQPPLIGTKQLLNFTAFSGPDIGGWIFVVSGLLAIGALLFELFGNRFMNKHATTAASVLLMATSLFSCNIESEPLQYGKDACFHCKMTLMDKKFGAEVVSKKGKVFKFDDANCMLDFLQHGELKKEDIEMSLITDFASPGLLIDATKASFIKSEQISSPMASNVAAFKDNTIARKFNANWQGQLLDWNELTTTYE